MGLFAYFPALANTWAKAQTFSAGLLLAANQSIGSYPNWILGAGFNAASIFSSNYGLGFNSTSGIVWTSSDTLGTQDLGVCRATAGVAEVKTALALGGTMRYRSTTPAKITSNQDNYNPGGSSWFQRWSTDASRNVTGMVFTAAQVDGQTHRVWNVDAQNIVLQHQNASSTAANRFISSTAADLTLAPNKYADFVYDGTQSRWLVALGN